MKWIKYIFLALVLLFAGKAFAQTEILSGEVYETFGGKKEPVYSANIFLVNKQNRYVNGVITNLDGKFNLPVPKGEKDLTVRISYIGKKTVNIPYKGQKTLNITLEDNNKNLKEVVVSGKAIERDEMGITRTEQTSATQKLDMTEIINEVPVGSVEEALQGQLSGVDIVLGGDPGARSSIRIRGTSSLNASSEPLIVIDGIPYSTEINDDFDFSTANEEDFGALLNLAPADIQSIEVLKDASATAIYGTKGSNGVLLIKTKKGSKGKTTFTLSSKYTSKYEPESVPLLDGSQYVAMMQDAIWNAANAKGLANAANELELLFNTNEINYEPTYKYFDEYNCNTDWLEAVKTDAKTFDNNLAISGGGEKARYRFSLGYYDEGGTTIGTDLKRLTSKMNIDYDFSKRLRVSADFSFSQTEKKANYYNVRSEALKKMPNKSPYYIDDETGKPTSQYFSYQSDFEDVFYEKKNKGYNYNPVAMAKDSRNNITKREEKIAFNARYLFPFKLQYRGYVSMNMTTTRNKQFLPQAATGILWTSEYANRSTDNLSDNFSLKTENKFIYNNVFADLHSFIFTGVVRTSQGRSFKYESATYGNASSELVDPTSGGTPAKMNSGDSESRSVSAILQGVYTFDRRYVFKATVNREGNSAMGKSHRFGTFPSFGFSWNIDKEPFMEDQTLVSMAKVRVGLGWSGNAPSGSALYYGAYQSLGSYEDIPAIYPVRIQLNNLKWESSKEWDLGFDLELWNGRLNTTFDYYYKYTSDLLRKKYKIPTTTGYSEIKYFNSGEVSNKGVEYRIDYKIIKNKDWLVSANFNISRNINKVEKLPGNMSTENYSFGNEKYAIKVVAGDPIGSFYGYKYKGVYQNTADTYAKDAVGDVMMDYEGHEIVMRNGSVTCYPGDAKYEDVNNDGVINEKDIVYLGNSNPLCTGGGGFKVKYKNVTLNTNLIYRYGQKVINSTRMNLENMHGTNNQSTAVLKRWRNEGDDTDIPRALYNMGFNYLGSDRFVEDASFLRLKTVTLTYSFPKSICKRFKINMLSVYCTGYDLLTFTDYKGQDPEVKLPTDATKLVADGASTPVSKRLSFGFNLNF